MQPVDTVPLHEATSERYLHYALSVITSRALPDVRDGLKPVQRRILYTLYHELNLKPDGRYRKTAAVVGEVMGKYHPHGDQAIYDALVRMAQSFSLRVPLVDGQGNFGSLDGDPPAAMRYTECRLAPLALELLDELGRRTVDYRPTYDGQRFEPIVLPAQLPHLLLNGSEGIAVGMATRIPPHHPGELIDATIAVLRQPDVSLDELLTLLRGPDFPTGGALLASAAELREIYSTGQGSVRLQATWREEKDGRKRLLVIDSVPYGQNKARLLEAIGEHVLNRRLPLVQDVRDESTEDVRVVLELKPDASAEAVMAWLYKHTSLQVSWPVNLTALVPSDRPDVATPARLDLRSLLQHWLTFRVETLRRRYQHDLEELERRIHVLEGFALVFDALDEIIALIRASEGRRDAHERLIDRFRLTDEQAEAILELRLYRLARLEIHLIREELADKRNQAAEIRQILASEASLRGRLEAELRALREVYADPRRTRLGGAELSYEEQHYIVAEDAFLVVTRDGWFKRQSSFTDLSRIRVREGDEVAWVVRASTRSTVSFFGSQGGAWTLRLDDVPATAGYGEPLARHLALADGERVVGVLSHDPRHALLPAASSEEAGATALVLTQSGRSLRFPLASLVEPSTRAGRRVARLEDGDAVFGVWPCRGDEWLCLASTGGRALSFLLSEVPEVKAAGKGVSAIKIDEGGDALLAAELHLDPHQGPKVSTALGREVVVSQQAYGGPRGGGKVVVKRGGLSGWTRGVTLVGLEGAGGASAGQEV